MNKLPRAHLRVLSDFNTSTRPNMPRPSGKMSAYCEHFVVPLIDIASEAGIALLRVGVIGLWAQFVKAKFVLQGRRHGTGKGPTQESSHESASGPAFVDRCEH